MAYATWQHRRQDSGIIIIIIIIIIMPHATSSTGLGHAQATMHHRHRKVRDTSTWRNNTHAGLAQQSNQHFCGIGCGV